MTADEVRNRRERAGFSVPFLAGRAGVDAQRVDEIEKGEKVDAKIRAAVEAALRTPADL